jgi:hypothetical protein
MKRNQDRGGFALIISLGIMALIILLILAMTSMIRVEIEKSSGDHARSVAKNNALLALKEAIGNLQKYAGPDTRSTASAQLLNEINPKWTGIWPSDENASLGAGITPGEPVWLVSNETDITPDRKLTNPITLKKYNKDGNSYSKVEAGLKKVDSSYETGSGGYAWWVEDESLKASLFPQNAVRSVHETTDSSNSVYQQIQSGNLEMVDTSRRFGVFPGSSPQVLGQDWKDFDYSAFENRDYSILTSLENLPLVKTNKGSGSSVISKDQLSKYLFDFTITNKGVLANAWSGGLRKDLTRGLDDQYEDKLSNQLIFQDVDSSGDPIYGDPWKFFRDFYKTYKSNESYIFNNKTVNYTNFADIRDLDSSFVSRGTNRNLYGALGFVPYKQAYPTADSYPHFYTSNIRPTLLRLRVGIGFSTVETSVGSGQYQARIHFYPSVSLWNPFNFPIDLSRCYANNGTITTNANHIANLIILYINYLYININGTFANKTSALRLNSKYLIIRMPTTGVIEPGAIKVFALSNTGLTTGGVNLVDAINPSVTADHNVYETMPSAFTYSAATPLTLNGLSEGIRSNASAAYMEPRILVAEGPARAGMNNGERNYYSTTSRFDDTGLIRPYPIATRADQVANETQPSQIAVFEIGAPLMNGSSERMSVFSQLNPLGYDTIQLNNGSRPADLFYNNRGFSGIEDPITGENNEEIHIDPVTGNGFYGATNLSGSGGQTEIVIYDVPRHPMTSIAEFMHANSSHFRETATYPVASSIPCIGTTALSQTFQDTVVSNVEISGIDLPYYLNRALFDDYFFSTIPSGDSTNVYPYNVDFGSSDSANNYIESKEPLSNPRLVYYKTPTISELRDNSNSFETAAAHLFIDGAFNVNSLSVNAWAGVLSGFRGMGINGANRFTNDQRSPLPRHFVPRNDDSNPYTGYTSLTDNEILTLANSIVNEIRERRNGTPFSRLADFINRDPTQASKSSNEDEKMGLLDEAIMNSGINNNLTDGDSPTDLVKGTNNAGNRTYLKEVQPYNTGLGMSGWLTQQDILRPLAPIMTTRSDTFRIRSYGQYKNAATNEIEGQSWIEAIVQRIPDYIDANQEAWAKTDQLNAVNSTFGRKFQVISFKWLNEEGI